MKTRRLHALAREEAVDGLAVNAEDPPHANRVQPAVVNEPTDRLGMHAELTGDLADADQPGWLALDRRHNPPSLSGRKAQRMGRTAQMRVPARPNAETL